MTRSVAVLCAAAASWLALALGASDAQAQTCTQPQPGVAEVGTAGVAVSVRIVAGMPRVNDVSCGFAASQIRVVGTAADDRVTLLEVPATIPVSTELGAGMDTVTVQGTAARDVMMCRVVDVDRDGGGAPDLGFGASFIEILVLRGGAGNDVLSCPAFAIAVTLDGEAGNDTVRGGAFADLLLGGGDNDTILGNAGDDRIDGGPGRDSESGGAGLDTFEQGTSANGADRIDGGDDRDTLSYAARSAGVVAGAGAAEDTIVGPIEVVNGGGGDDTLDFSASTIPVTLSGGGGNDLLDGSGFDDVLTGNAGNDTLVGNAGADRLFGSAGADRLSAGAGKDTLDAGDGSDGIAATKDDSLDVIQCGSGADTYFPSAEDVFAACETIGGTAPTASSRLAAALHTCALLDDDTVRCWGLSGIVGDLVARGDEPGEMGANLPPVDFGTGRTAVAIAASEGNVCAILDNGKVKCLGENGNAELGIGRPWWDWRGDEPGDMGDHLPAAALGNGRTAISLALGYFHSCALLDNGKVKCWGAVSGYGDTEIRGDEPHEMGDFLPAIDLGSGRTAIAITAGQLHTCALLDDSSVKCWGLNANGQLGLGFPPFDIVGDEPGEMGDALPAVDLGTGRTARAIVAGIRHTCALLDDGRVKCWGENGYGALGLGDTRDRGDQPGEMGDALPVVDLGAGRIVTALAAYEGATCATLVDGAVKCWGGGVLGYGDLEIRGDQPGDMGDALPLVDLGTGRTVAGMAMGFARCAVLDDSTVKCFGHNQLGGLGLGDTEWRGDDPGEMGDALPAVDLPGTLTP